MIKIAGLVLVGTLAIAIPAVALVELPVDGRGQKIQGFAPNGKISGALTVNSVTKTSYIQWETYTPTACKFRLMSTATKAGTQYTLPADTFNRVVYNPATPYTNFSGCTNGEYKAQ